MVSNNYNNVRITNINRNAIINNYRPAPVISNNVIPNYNQNKAKFNFTNVNPAVKPHQSVINKIDQNMMISKNQQATLNAKTLEQNVTKAKQGMITPNANIGTPKMTSKIVPAGDMNKPPSQLQFQQKNLVGTPKPAQASTGAKALGLGVQPTTKTGAQIQQGQPGTTGATIRPQPPGVKAVRWTTAARSVRCDRGLLSGRRSPV